jgi:dihydroorotase
MPEGSLFIKGGRIVDPANHYDETGNILIEHGSVRAVGRQVEADPGTPILDASGLLVTPGFIDSHVHLREPGFEHKETIATGTRSAAAGGFTAVVAMPNTEPPPDTGQRIADFLERAAQQALVRVYAIGCISTGREGHALAPLKEMAEAGAIAFSDDGDPIEDADLMQRALQTSAQLQRPIFPHEEVRAITRGGCMHEGETSRRLAVRGMPAAGEEEMIARDIELVRQTWAPLHLAHISTAGTVQLVQQAKADGLPVTSEVLPHHFILTDRTVESLGAQAKMSPPLRGRADVEAMLRGLADGTIDTIATDHAPHTAQEKALDLEQAPFGIVGLETALGLTFTYLLKTGVLELPDAVAKWTSEPARILRLAGGTLSVGSPGDVTVIDPDLEWTVEPDQMQSKSSNTPFGGYQLTGRAVATVVAGQVVYRYPQNEGASKAASR